MKTDATASMKEKTSDDSWYYVSIKTSLTTSNDFANKHQWTYPLLGLPKYLMIWCLRCNYI